MHHLFKMGDLINLIIKCMDPEIMDIETRDLWGGQPLLNLALTSKIFLPALDILWCTQTSMGPLLLVLPHDVWELSRNGSDGARSCRGRTLIRTLVKFTFNARGRHS